METRSFIFVTIDKLVSPSSSVNGDPLDDFPDHWQPRFSARFPWETEGADWPAPSKRNDLLASGCYGSGDLVERRVSDVIGFNLMGSLNYCGEDLRHFWVSSAVVSLGILPFVPQTDSEPFPAVMADGRDFVLESF